MGLSQEVEMIEIKQNKIPLLPTQEAYDQYYQNLANQNLAKRSEQNNIMQIMSTNYNDMRQIMSSLFDLRTELDRVNRNRRRLLYLCLIYVIALIYFTIIFRNADGFNFRSLTSLYLMVLGLFLVMFISNLEFCYKIK
jgi:hypothetical protein